MAEAVPGPAPQGEQLRALLDAPEHCLARLAQDLFVTPSACAATMEVCVVTRTKTFQQDSQLHSCHACSGRTICRPLDHMVVNSNRGMHLSKITTSASLRM